MTFRSDCVAHALLSLMILWGAAAAEGGGRAADRKGNSLPVGAGRVIHSLMTADPRYADVLVSERNIAQGRIMLFSSVPNAVRQESLAWMRTVVRAKWLPKDLEKHLSAHADLRIWEKRDERGQIVSQMIGDYVIADYQVAGHRIWILENGVNVSLLVRFPVAKEMSPDPLKVFGEWTTDFLNVAEGARERLAGRVSVMEGLYYGNLTTSDWQAGEGYWWENLAVCSDGTFFFVACYQLDGAVTNPQAKPGLPDRF